LCGDGTLYCRILLTDEDRLSIEPRNSAMAHAHNLGDFEQWSMVVVYDHNTGEIVHTHECLSLPGGKHPDRQKLERDALEYASRAGADTAATSLLHVDPQNLVAGSQYKVDSVTKVLVEVPHAPRRKPSPPRSDT
jgi:hypothetical protein